MCVIVTAEKGSMPTIDQLTRMSETNPDGAGIAWQTGQTDLTDGTQGKFAKIDQNGRIQWLTPPQTIEGAEGEPIQVSNTRWQDTIWDEWRTEYDDAYIEDWNDGYEAAINDMLNDGIDTTTGIRRR